MRLHNVSLGLLLVATFASAEQKNMEETMLRMDQLSADGSFDFDSVTEQMIATGIDQEIEIKPPSKIVVWLSKLGMPFVIKLAHLYQKCIEFWRHANHSK